MDTYYTIIFFILGFVLLIKGADILVTGSSSVAKRYGISSLLIGLTIVAFGTSAPELAVGILSAAKGSGDIAIGNVLGSNIANIFLVLGVTALLFSVKLKSATVWKEIPFTLLGVAVLFAITNDILLSNRDSDYITRGDGIVLLLFFVIFIYYVISTAKSGTGTLIEQKGDIPKKQHIGKSIIYILGGLAAVYLGGQMLVDSAVQIATWLGLSEAFIGLTLIAIGTSLPELVTSIVAALKKEPDIAVGNVIGSGIFNVFLVLGTTALVGPIKYNIQLNADIIMVAIATLAVFLFMFIGKKQLLEKWQGGAMVTVYAAYMVYLVIRG